ncbi:peptidoglycan-binding protein [Rhodobium gokarnense]|uniref:Localization factor PodJL n=1 Tax=Rhodobium gokarnense TaxID=364296 RepID=A0ABT3H9L5_9HYPH|nr:peptidoglycan-binding protein [Rhodobium gokarnense]MCW2307085.1 localization factor PodJL [Rhodobium gokarnense]
MFRNRPNAHAATPRSATAGRHGPSDPLADLNSRLDALSERLGQLNAGAASKMPPRREAAAPRNDDLAGITETVDRLMTRLDARSSGRERNGGREPAGGRNGGARKGREADAGGDASRGRIDAILETLDGIDRRMRNLPANGETPSQDRRTVAAARNPSFEAADGEEDALRRAIDEITARQQTLDHDGYPIHNHNTGREPARTPRRDEAEAPARSRAYDRDDRSFGLPDVEHHFKALADKIDSLRQSDTEAAVERLRREIGNLRHEIERRDTASLSDDDATMIRALGQKVETLSAAQSDPRAVEALRDEIAELRQSVISGNVEGTLHSLESGYQHIVERLDEMRRTVGDPRLLVRLADRIDTIDSALKTIPQVGQINTLEQRVTQLARQIDGLSMDMNDPAIGQLEGQIADLKGLFSGLDTQAAVATLDQQLRALHDKIDGLERLAAEPPAQPEPVGDGYLEAIERLSGQIEDLRDAMSGGRDADRFTLIESNIAAVAQKLDELEDARTQDDAILALERRIDDMIARVEEIVPGADTGSGDAFAALEARINQIADRLDSFEPGRQMGDGAAFAELEETIQRIDDALQRTSGSDALAALDRKVASLAAQLDDLGRAPLDLSEMANLRDEIAGMRMAFSKPIPVDLTRLERQIHNLADKVGGSRGGVNANALAHLEDQVARIAQLLGDRSEQSEALGAIETALTHLDRRLDSNRDEAARAARDAAREAIAEFARERSSGGGNIDNDEQIRELQFHLDKLRATTVDSAERTQDTLVTLHDALQAISSKLTGYEPANVDAETRGIAVNGPAGYDAGPDRFATASGATLDASSRPQHAAEPHRDPRAPSPGSAEDSRPLEPGAGRPDQSRPDQSRPDQNRADQNRAEAYRPDAPREPQARRVEVDPDEPLAPGIMAETLAPDPAGRDRKTDFIAAARRAAQAAAAEADGAADAKPAKKRSWFRRRKGEAAAEAPERPEPAPRMEEPAPEDDIYATPLAGSRNGPEEDGASGVSGALKKYRRPLMIAAVGLIVIFLGNQLMKAFLTPVNETASIEQSVAPTPPAPEIDEPAPAQGDEAPAAAPAAPADDDRSSSAADPAGTGSDPQTTSAAGFDMAASNSNPQAEAARQALGPGTADAAPETVTAYAPQAAQDAGNAPAAIAMPPSDVGPIALRAAAADGNPEAQFEVAARYTEGRGVRPDLTLAAKWYRLAADQGLAPAQYRLGSLYEKGTGVRKDMDEARKWYRRAAEQGNTKAMHNLAVLYAEGASGSPDFSSAAQWFNKAASAGVRDSQYNLGILHARGLGVAQDLKDSYKWFALAARQGDTDAGKKRDEIANALDRQGLAAARLAVETWRAAPVDEKANGVTPHEEWGNAPERSASARPQAVPAQVTQQQLTQSAQQLLTELGYDPGPADGVSGPRTRDAVMDFQRKAGLPVTGQVDGRLIKALSKETI